jgi:hypothetical protein
MILGTTVGSTKLGLTPEAIKVLSHNHHDVYEVEGLLPRIVDA